MTFFVYELATGSLVWYWVSPGAVEAPSGMGLIEAPPGADGSWITTHHVVDGVLTEKGA